jgi:C-terminal processing protease CtpA/Prc
MKPLYALVLALFGAQSGIGQQPPSVVTGMTLIGGSSDSCPVIVAGVSSGSPAERVGIKSGDALIAVDGKRVATSNEAAKLLHSETATPVSLQLRRGETAYTVTVGRVRLSSLLEKSGNRLLSTGTIVPPDFTETEMSDKMKALTLDRFADRVFPAHYPNDEKLYYGGFEVLTLKNPPQVVVLGIEDGPASRAGIHWGDTILSVNGIDPQNKPVAELEKLFSSEKPATMTLKIERGSITKTYVIELEQAAQVLLDNKTQLVHGNPMPLGIPERYLHCFFD